MWSGIINSVSFNHSQNQAPGSVKSPHTHQRGEHRGINPRHTKKGYLTICDSRVVDPVGKGVLPTLFYIQMRWLQWASHFFAIGSCCWREDEPTSRKKLPPCTTSLLRTVGGDSLLNPRPKTTISWLMSRFILAAFITSAVLIAASAATFDWLVCASPCG